MKMITRYYEFYFFGRIITFGCKHLNSGSLAHIRLCARALVLNESKMKKRGGLKWKKKRKNYTHCSQHSNLCTNGRKINPSVQKNTLSPNVVRTGIDIAYSMATFKWQRSFNGWIQKSFKCKWSFGCAIAIVTATRKATWTISMARNVWLWDSIRKKIVKKRLC